MSFGHAHYALKKVICFFCANFSELLLLIVSYAFFP